MRRLILAAILAGLALPAGAAKRVTVAQLEQALTAASAAHKADADVARQLAGMELSERLTDAALGRLKASLTPGSTAAEALELLADESQFLDPPQSELPATAGPDEAAQQRMIAAARNYVAQTLPRLPNFLATRTINRYDDSPQTLKKGGWPTRMGLHRVDTSSREISVRDERENQPPTQGSAVWKEQIGLISGGEFGTTLGMILTDTLEGRVSWGHWEQGAAGPVAVLRYAVPKAASHFELIGTLRRQAALEGHATSMGGSRGTAGIGMQTGGVSQTNTSIFHTRPAYHGQLWLDPASGAVLRITLEGETKDSAQFWRAAIEVEYGPVEIGGSQFICPLRSLALSMAQADAQTSLENVPTEWLNETLFTGYHRFAATTRILADKQEMQPERPESAGEVSQAAPPKPDEAAPAMGEARPAPSGTPAPSSPPISTESAPAVPAALANEPQSAGPTIQVNVERVLIPVVVRDKQGHALEGLTAEDFQVFDNDKPRAVAHFAAEKRGAEAGNALAGPASAVAPAAVVAAPQAAALPRRVTVFVFDDMHMSEEETANARNAGNHALAGALTGADVAAVVSISGKTNSGLTRDRAKLLQALAGLEPRSLYRVDTADCPKIDYYQADLILNKRDYGATQDAVRKVFNCNPGLDAARDGAVAQAQAESAARRALSMGEQDVQATFATISEVVRRMAALPGQHTMIVVSSGFLPVEQQARIAESRLMDLAAQSNVTISALDARGLYTNGWTASEHGPALAGPSLLQNSDYKNSALKLAEDGMAELADGTGGRFFHNSNDLDAGLRDLAETPETVYVLELSLEGVKPDGGYHRLKVKVNREGVELQARRGYFAPKAEKGKK